METQFIRSDKEKGFSMIDNTILRDLRLSWKAKGIFCYILSLPITWKIYMKELMAHSEDGESSFRAGIKELEKYGYIVKQKVKNPDGKFAGYHYIVIEKPYSDFPHTDNPNVDNQQLLNTNKEILNNQSISKKVNKGDSVGISHANDEPLVFDSIPKKENIFEKTRKYYGDGIVDEALRIVDEFIDIDYPKFKKKKHPQMNKAQRMAFVAKICECSDVTNVDLSDIETAMYQAIQEANCDPTILYVTTPKVLGYWLINQKDVGYESVHLTEYEPVEEYY